MQQILATFGVDWRLLLVNTINFAILLGVLWYFLYTPLVRLLEERRQKVAQGVADAEAAGVKLSEVEHSRAGVLAAAGAEADTLVANARTVATQKEKELLQKGEAAAAAAVREAQAQAAEIKARALEESKHEVAKLIVLGIEKAVTK